MSPVLCAREEQCTCLFLGSCNVLRKEVDTELFTARTDGSQGNCGCGWKTPRSDRVRAACGPHGKPEEIT